MDGIDVFIKEKKISMLSFNEFEKKSQPVFLFGKNRSGTLPLNPSELLGSMQMKKFLDTLKEKFDLIIIDSPPSVSVTDAEILFTVTDGTILVCKAGKTDKQIYFKTYKKFYSMNRHNLLGCVLNDFKYKSSYGYYYNYYYSAPGDKQKKKK